MSVTPSQFDLLRKSLDAVTMRHKAISRNLANVNTPGFRTLEVSFEDQLARQLRMDGSNLTNVSPTVDEATGLVERYDGNNVDLDREVSELEKSSLLYETYTQLLATKLSLMRSAITGR